MRLKKVFFLALLGVSALPVDTFCQVDTAWVRRYNGPGNDWDEPYAIAADDSGNVYVVGFSYGTGASWTVLKYNRNGDLAWLRQRPGTLAAANNLVLDSAGYAYVTGASESFGANLDYTTVKYDPQGNEIWANQYDGPASGADWGVGITLDKRSNTFVTGSSADSGGGREIATIKYGPDGNQRWTARYNSPLNLHDWGGFIAVDDNQNVYVAGHSGDSPGHEKEWITIKYDSLGQEKWVRTFSLRPNTDQNWATKIRVDLFGNVIVTGGSLDILVWQVDYVTVKYDSLGDTVWIAHENGSPYSENLVIVLDLDSLGNVYVSGYSGFDIATIKYDFNGNKLWEHRYTSPASGPTYPSGIKVDKAGSVYVAGVTRGIGTKRDFTALKLDSMGNELWAVRYIGPDTSSDDLATYAAFDEIGNVYITGRTDGNGQSDFDIMTLKFAPLPTVRGDLNLDGILTLGDVVLAINQVFLGEVTPAAPSAGDFNCDGLLTGVDVVILLRMFYLGVTAPC